MSVNALIPGSTQRERIAALNSFDQFLVSQTNTRAAIEHAIGQKRKLAKMVSILQITQSAAVRCSTMVTATEAVMFDALFREIGISDSNWQEASPNGGQDLEHQVVAGDSNEVSKRDDTVHANEDDSSDDEGQTLQLRSKRRRLVRDGKVRVNGRWIGGVRQPRRHTEAPCQEDVSPAHVEPLNQDVDMQSENASEVEDEHQLQPYVRDVVHQTVDRRGEKGSREYL
ncbi:hypothetical protein FI667_g13716, partial [Globisporangium splendens]